MEKALTFLRQPAIYHTLFWLSYFIINWIRWGSYYDDYNYSFQSNLVEFPLHVVLVYFILYFLMPRFVPGKVGRFILFILLSTLVISYIKIVMTFFLVTTEIYKEANRTDIQLFDFVYVAAVFIGELYVVAVVMSIKLTMDWIRFKNRTSKLEKLNLETELAFLKSQIQPHFFFNTLNNLYSLTLDKSSKAPNTVLKLSELMSYVIYDAKQKKVPLVNEIKHIQNYLDLEKLRYGERLEVQLSVSGNIEGKRIPPILLLPFIENSFKHGSQTRDAVIPISISLSVDDSHLTFECENNKNRENSNGLPTENRGIGLQNTKRRLKLLFDNNFDLSIVENDERFKIVLKFPVS